MTRVGRLYGAAGAIAAVLALGEATAQTITTTTPLPDATEGTAYSLQFAASGGSGGYRWSTGCCPPCGFPGCPPTTGLPPGLSFSPTGLLDGTPTASGSFSFWVWLDDSTGAGTVGVFVLHVRPSTAYSFSRWVPVAAHNPGLSGSAWRTDLGILNATTSAANVEIDFYGFSSGIVSRMISAPARAQLMLADVVGQLGLSGQGALEILSDQPLKVTSRTYSLIPSDASCLPDGTQGQDYPALAASEGLVAGQSAYLAGLVENASFRSNIGLVNTSRDSATVLVELYDATGTELANYSAWLMPGEWVQETQPFLRWADQRAMDRGYARITVDSGSGIFAFASVVDNLTNDPTRITAGNPVPAPIWVPVAAHNPGLSGSAWRTDLGILNPTTSAATVEIDFYGGYSGILSTTISVAAAAQLMLVDVVAQLGASDQGALEILSDQPLKVSSRTYSRIPSDASCLPDGTQGQEYPTLTPSDGLVAGQSAYLAGLVENTSFRSNIGLVNTGPDSATVLVELYDGTGTKLANYTVVLQAYQWSQAVQPFWNLAGETAMDSGYAKVTVQSGSGVFAFASVIDNLTNDPTAVTMQR